MSKIPDYKLIGGLVKPQARGKPVKSWYQYYRLESDPTRKVRKCPLYSDKQRSKQKAKELVEAHILRTCCGDDPRTKFAGYSLLQHLDDYITAMKTEETVRRYQQNTKSRITRVAADLRWTTLEQIEPHALRGWLQKMKTEGETRRRGKRDEPKHYLMSDATAGYYWKAFSSFASWAVAAKRLDTHPLAGVKRKRKGEAHEPEWSRRALSADELGRLVQAARVGKRFKRLTGEQRSWLYLFCASTGLRAHEASSVTPRSFDWEQPATVIISSRISKRRKTDVIQLPDVAAEQLRVWVESLPADEPVFPGLWWQDASEMIKRDLRAAGIDDHDEDGKVVDFHALRTTHITSVVATGIPLPLVMRICRLSTADLLRNYYKPTDDIKTQAINSLVLPTV